MIFHPDETGLYIVPIGIGPIYDFTFEKTFGSPENHLALIHLLNAILELPQPMI